MPNERHTNSLGTKLEGGIADPKKAKFGTADFLLELEKRRSIKVCSSFVTNYYYNPKTTFIFLYAYLVPVLLRERLF